MKRVLFIDRDGTLIDEPDDEQIAVLRTCETDSGILELMSVTGRSNRTKFRDRVMGPLLANGLIEMTIPDKPSSSKQKYRLTDEGRALITQSEGELANKEDDVR